MRISEARGSASTTILVPEVAVTGNFGKGRGNFGLSSVVTEIGWYWVSKADYLGVINGW